MCTFKIREAVLPQRGHAGVLSVEVLSAAAQLGAYEKFHLQKTSDMWMTLCLSVPSKPQDAAYISSTESSMTLSWRQSGAVDNYIIEYNDTVTTSVNFTGVGHVSMSATVQDLPTSGTYYCVSVTAVSGHLRSHSAVLCNYTGAMPTCFLLDFLTLVVCLYFCMFIYFCM